jgi:hypothetical protein
MALREGSPSIVRWSCPQLQAAWRVIVRLHNTGVQGYWSGALSRIRPKARETAPPARCSWKTLQIAPSYPRARGSTNPICTGVTGGVVLSRYGGRRNEAGARGLTRWVAVLHVRAHASVDMILLR